jgi:DNA-binding LytR/AlgR family response regulator
MKNIYLLELDEQEAKILLRVAQAAGLLLGIVTAAPEAKVMAAALLDPYIDIKHSNGITRLYIKDIVYLRGDGNSVTFWYLDTTGKITKLVTGKYLNQFAAWAKGVGFFRPNQSFFVNLNYTHTHLRKNKLVLTVDAQHKEISVTRPNLKRYKSLISQQQVVGFPENPVGFQLKRSVIN